MVEVKICGLSTRATLGAALDAGADYVGFVLYPRSPRNVAVSAAAELAEVARGHARTVLLMVDPPDALVDEASASVKPTFIQLHGSESPDRCREIKARSGRLVMKVIKVETAQDAEAALDYVGVADLFLFDTKAPKSLAGALPGGNGISFDWNVLAAVKDRVPYMLSGGLSSANVAEAVRQTGATRVDVSSGVESSPGIKDPELIRAFIRAAKG